MRQCLLLQLSADHMHAQHMVHGKIAAQAEFTDSEEGREHFATFLKSLKCPTYMMVDLIEEDFRQETVPHLIGGNRTALLQRKFDQFYRATPFRQSTLLQRQKTGRRDDDMLFSALTNPALILSWLEIILAQQTPLSGIYSVPQISAPLVKDHPSNHLLLLSWEKFAGLRQTYFSEHRLQISRLTPIREGLSFQDAVINELTRTYQYLKSLSLLPSGQTLDVRILCHSNDRNELQNKLPNDAGMRYDFADLTEFGKQLQIQHHFTDSDASQIFLHQLAGKPPKAHYANADHTHYCTVWQLRHALRLCSVALLLGCLLWGAADFWQGGSDAEEAVTTKAQTQRILNETKRLIQTFPVDPDLDSATNIKTSVVILRKLEQYGPVPQNILVPLSRMLDRYPKIQLDELAWQMSATEPVAPNTLAEVPAQIITLKGHLEAFENNYRFVLDYLDQFQRELVRQGYQVTALAKPLDVSPSGSITDQREAQQSTLGFSLKITWRPPL